MLMNDATAHDDPRDVFLEDVAAELTTAAYPILLRLGKLGKTGLWLDLELSLWKTLAETFKQACLPPMS